ncbi:MAG: MFS transporter [Sphingobium sp.]|uniref:MFS transporter n=1 Tax=Sphingobium sp. TaxID=1912891 RepID=UPI0029AB616B|nr:MFS transporter [Sphingobium sp.]MDX3910174.1 MFS transporter [Sphingobium sp.]
MAAPALMNAPLEPIPNWTDDEKPSMPGSPSTPKHSNPIRAAYIAIAFLLGITGGLGNALVSANLQNIQGSLGLTPVEAAWLPAAYLMVNISTSLILFKFRQQFGLRRFAEIGLPLYVGATILHLFADSYATALLARAVSGFAGATISTLAIFYTLQAFPKARLGQGLVIGLGISQLATPLAWLLSPALLDLDEWRTLYMFESGLALCCLAAVVSLKLPPGIRIKVFEGRDFLTFALLAPALALIVAVLAQGRTQWWTAQSWMAGALIAAVVLLVAAVLVEHHRANPLIQTRWLGTASTIRFAIGAMGMRFLLSEQTYGATGLLRTLGMGPDQLQPLYAVMLLGLVVGIGASALTFNQKAVIPQILASVVLIAIGSFLDWNATSLTRPHDMFLSQFLISTAAGLFMGPLLLVGVMSALKNGPNYIVSFAVLFGVSQSIGGLAGPAIFGTFQQFREHEYSATINAGVDPTNPIVSQRLQIQGQVYGRVITDPVLRQAQGTALLAQTSTREANVRAFDDVFLLNGILALLLLCWSLFHVLRLAIQAKTNPPASAGPATDAAAPI